METYSFQDSFSFHEVRGARVDIKNTLVKLYATKRPDRGYRLSDGKGYITVTWFTPRRFRTGMERIYCSITHGWIGGDGQCTIDYCGGSGLCKYNGAFYGCLYKMGLDLYKDDVYTSAHYAPVDVLPALVRHLFSVSDLTDWHVSKFSD